MRRCALFLLLLNVFTLRGQTLRQYMRAGNEAMEVQDFSAAWTHFSAALLWDSTNIEARYGAAQAAQSMFVYQKAADYFGLVNDDEAYPDARLRQAECLRSVGNYTQAKPLFEQYLSKNNASEAAKRGIGACNFALAQLPSKVEVSNVGNKINSPFSDFAPMMRGDTLYYSSYRFPLTSDEHTPPRLLTKLMTQRGTARGTAWTKMSDDRQHTAHATFSTDGLRMYFTRCEYAKNGRIKCRIEVREKDKKQRWGAAKPLPNSINMADVTNTQPTVGLDSTCGCEVLYFVSDRIGGVGKLDIWRTTRLGNEWSAPTAITVNTPEDDLTPFWHTPTQTLFFSSGGRTENMGGYDVYQWRTGSKVPTPMPLNSSFHDLYFSLNDEGSVAYFASNRVGAQYLDPNHKNCCFDIYRATFPTDEPQMKPPNPIPPADSTSVPPMSSIPPPVSIPPPPAIAIVPPVPTRLEDFLPLSLYFDNDRPDPRSTRPTTLLAYEDTYLSFYPLLERYKTNYTAQLSDAETEDAALAVDVFFEDSVRFGYERLFLFSDILLARLQSGDRVEIVIKGYTSPRAESKYNDILAARRIDCARNHFRSYASGVFQAYINAGQLKITAAPFGERTSSNSVSDKLDDLRNSVYSPAAARERRVEIIEVKVL